MKSYILSLSLCLLFLTSCSVFTNKGKLAKQEETNRARIVNIDNKISANLSYKMDQVSALAFGTDYALNKVTNSIREVEVAKDINKRIISLSGSPSIEIMKEMQDTIDKLISTLNIEREDGLRRLNKKDKELSLLQSESKNLLSIKDAEIKKYMLIAQESAANADLYKTELNKMNSWFGLGAVFYGLKKFIISSMWILGIGSILFMILRFASMSNPIAGSIFSIFNIIGSWIVNGVKMLFPKAIEMAGHTTTSIFKAYKSTMTKMIDGIQTLKDRQKAIGDPNKKFTLDELFIELSKLMSDDDKKRVDEIKREIGY